MLCNKVVSCEFDPKRNAKTNYRDSMAKKYRFPSQAVAWSGMMNPITRNGADLSIRFRDPTWLWLSKEKQYFKAVSVLFYNWDISYFVTPDGYMCHLDYGRICDVTPMP
jgi:hypothetical protein